MKRLTMTACPACEHVNTDDSRTCAACGSPLVARCPACGTINARTRTRCHHCATRLIRSADGTDDDELEGDELETVRDDATLDGLPAAAPSVARSAAPSAALEAPGLPAWNLTLRADRIPVPPRQRPRRSPLAPAPAAAARVRGVVAADPQAAAATAVVAAQAQAVPVTPAVAPAARQTRWGDVGGVDQRKAEVRAAVRRARLRQQRRAVRAGEAALDVLLIEPDPTVRARLAGLLEQFGFRPHAVAGVGDAAPLLGNVRFSAAFVGLGGTQGDAVGFCSGLRDGTASKRPRGIVAMIDADRHADRVRVELAGVHTVLMRPVGRGQLAQALEDCGIPMPQDPRAR